MSSSISHPLTKIWEAMGLQTLNIRITTTARWWSSSKWTYLWSSPTNEMKRPGSRSKTTKRRRKNRLSLRRLGPYRPRRWTRALIGLRSIQRVTIGCQIKRANRSTRTVRILWPLPLIIIIASRKSYLASGIDRARAHIRHRTLRLPTLGRMRPPVWNSKVNASPDQRNNRVTSQFKLQLEWPQRPRIKTCCSILWSWSRILLKSG